MAMFKIWILLGKASSWCLSNGFHRVSTLALNTYIARFCGTKVSPFHARASRAAANLMCDLNNIPRVHNRITFRLVESITRCKKKAVVSALALSDIQPLLDAPMSIIIAILHLFFFCGPRTFEMDHISSSSIQGSFLWLVNAKGLRSRQVYLPPVVLPAIKFLSRTFRSGDWWVSTSRNISEISFMHTMRSLLSKTRSGLPSFSLRQASLLCY